MYMQVFSWRKCPTFHLRYWVISFLCIPDVSCQHKNTNFTRLLVNALPCLNSPFNCCPLFFRWFFNFHFLQVLIPLNYISLVLTFTVPLSQLLLSLLNLSQYLQCHSTGPRHSSSSYVYFRLKSAPIFTLPFNWSPLSFPTFQQFLLLLSNGSDSLYCNPWVFTFTFHWSQLLLFTFILSTYEYCL